MTQHKPWDRIKVTRIFLLLLLDILLINLSSFLALFTRMELDLTALLESGFLDSIYRYALMDTVCTILIFWFFRLYNSLWAYAGTNELTRIAAASIVAAAVKYVGMHLLALPTPKSFPVLNCMFLMAFVGCSRLAYRYFRDILHRSRKSGAQKRTMLIGAGDAGAIALLEFQNSQHSSNQVVCIIDDASRKRGQLLRGVPIVGGRESILAAAEKYRIQEIVLAIPSASSRQQRAILSICQKTKCTLRTLPAIYQLANGEVSIQKIRNVEIEDLLGRDSVQVDLAGIGKHVAGKTILVTGGGGSIGSELCRQLATFGPAQLILFDIYENNAYDIQQELRRTYPNLNLTVLIGSVRDRERLEDLFARYHPDLIYHAADRLVAGDEEEPAGSIPVCHFRYIQGAKNVVFDGLAGAVLHKRDVLVGSATNVMGATKRVCEMIIQMMDGRSKTEYVAVRFGNVLGSNGSVIPLFKKQIAAGGPVTVTDPQIIRYFMTIPEAVSLVLQAGVYAKGGEIFILDMGDPVRIDDLARNMIRLSGFEPDVDIPIVYTGLRPGEKLFEELLLSGEGMRKTQNDLIYIGKDQPFDGEKLEAQLQSLYQAAVQGRDVRDLLAQIVPEYRVPVHT
jgi:FlaA1/EpsC-like NDP-sugar epimerase